METTMSNVRIVFNRSNIDAVCSAAMIIAALRMDSIVSIESVPYSLTSYSGPNNSISFSKTFLIGLFLNEQEILAEREQCKDLYIITNSKPLDNYKSFDIHKLTKHCDKPIFIYSSYFVKDTPVQNVDESYSSCMSKLAKLCLEDLGLLSSFENTTNYSNMVEVASAMEEFVSIKDVTAEQILIVHENYDTLVESAYTAKTMEFKGLSFVKDKIQENPGRKNTIKGVNQRIFKSRNFIQNSMASQHYRNSKSSMLAQTIQVSEDYLYDITRLAAYPYQVVVTYQDHKHKRHWWIYSSNDVNANALVGMIPHLACFTDGAFIHLVSEIPKIEIQ